MGHNPRHRSTAHLSTDAQAVVDEYKARSAWGAWWSLSEPVRRRYFTHDERLFVTRYGARLDELACMRVVPRNDAERHFVQVCIGELEPSGDRERLWLRVQLVCRYERSVTRAAEADLARHDAAALRAENRALKAQVDHLEGYVHQLFNELRHYTGTPSFPTCNVVHASLQFRRPETMGPPARRFVITAASRGEPVGRLTGAGLR